MIANLQRVLGQDEYWGAVLSFVFGTLITLGAFVLGWHWDEQIARAGFEAKAAQLFETVQREIRLPLLRMETALPRFVSPVSRAPFLAWARAIERQHAGALTVFWAPQVRQDQLSSFLEWASHEGLGMLTIREGSPQGSLRSATPRSVHLPLALGYPDTPSLLGYDLLTHPELRRAADRAKDEARLIVTTGFHLEPSADGPGPVHVAALRPSFSGPDSPASRADRQQSFRGVTVALLRVDKVLAATRLHVGTKNLDFALTQSGTPGTQVLYESEYDLYDSLRAYEHRVSRSIQAGDQRFTLLIAPAGDDLDAPWQVRATVLRLGPAATVILSLLLAVVRVMTLTRRARRERQKLGEYRLHQVMHDGNRSTIFRASHGILRRPTAVKILKVTSPELVARFGREVGLATRLQHPATVAVYDYGRTLDGRPYYAMELVHGVTLERITREFGPLPPGRVLRLMRQVLLALNEAHQLGVVHRDIQPGNIMVGVLGFVPDSVKLIDFGVARDLESPDGLTRPGQVIGSPRFCSPEQATGTASPASDLYSVGATAYTLLTGSYVFEGPTLAATFAALLQQEPEPPSRRAGQHLGTALDAWIIRALAKRPRDRYANANEMIGALDGLLSLVEPWTDTHARAWWEMHPHLVPPIDERSRTTSERLTVIPTSPGDDAGEGS